MTDRELSELEGTERANVEARIKCLRNIQVLLDAAVLEMQQYSSVVSRISTNTSTTPQRATVNEDKATSKPPTETPSPVTEKKIEESQAPTAETGARAKIKPSRPDVPGEDKDLSEIIEKMDASSRKDESTERIEVRRRWLEKFKDNPDSNGDK